MRLPCIPQRHGGLQQPEKVEYMAHAEKCPICNGTGKIEKGGDTTDAKFPITCHGCFGRGWITICEGSRGRMDEICGGPWDETGNTSHSVTN